MLGLKDIDKEDKFETVTDLRCNLYKHSEMLLEKLKHRVIYSAIP